MELLLIATLAGQRIALRASDVQSVIEIDTITPVPRAPKAVAGLAALRSQVLTVIDCRRAMGLGETRATCGKWHGAVIDRQGHSYALLVDSIDDVVSSSSGILPLPVEPGEAWSKIAVGRVEIAHGTLLVLDMDAAIFGIETAIAA